MALRTRFWRSSWWRDALHDDDAMAQAEGLAAGTGLLTGELVRTTPATASACPLCVGVGDVVAIDLIAESVSHRCRSCGHRWIEAQLPARLAGA